MTVQDKIVPNLVGVDIGCGVLTVELQDKNINLEKLDAVVHEKVPAGFNIHQKPYGHSDCLDEHSFCNIYKLRCREHVDIHRAELSCGTLGGGNHFIELAKDDNDKLYLIIHFGSRNLGKI